MRSLVRPLVVLLSAICLCGLQPTFSAPLPQTKPQTTKSVWEVHQVHSSLGPTILFVAADGVFIRNDDFSWGFICKAPDWKAVFYRAGSKRISILPYKTWLKQGFAASDLADQITMPATATAEAGRYCRLPVVLKRWTGVAPKLSLMSESIVGAKQCGYLLTYTKAIDAPSQVSEAISRFYKIPDLPGIPLALRTSQKQEGRLLSTSMAAPTRISVQAFEAPKGYTLMKTDGEVWVEEDDRQDVEAIGRDMFGK